MPALPRRSSLRLALTALFALLARPARAAYPRLSEVWRCGAGDCPGYEYDPMEGDPDHNAPPGTAFQDLSDDWFCPRCGAAKVEFRRLMRR